MLIYFIAQTVASLIERELRVKMVEEGLEKLSILPEGRPTRTPTVSHVMDRFEHRFRQRLFDGQRLVKTFAEHLSQDQQTVLKLLSVPISEFK